MKKMPKPSDTQVAGATEAAGVLLLGVGLGGLLSWWLLPVVVGVWVLAMSLLSELR